MSTMRVGARRFAPRGRTPGAMPLADMGRAFGPFSLRVPDKTIFRGDVSPASPGRYRLGKQVVLGVPKLDEHPIIALKESP